MNRLEQLDKGTLFVHDGKLVAAVEVYDLTQQCHLFHPALDQLTHFANDLSNRPASFRSTGPRDDAKSAVHIAALHDGNKRRRLLRSEGVVTDRLLRASFFRGVD